MGFHDPPASLLVRATNWLGDAVMTTPALAGLREALPEARIVLLARPLAAELFRHHPDVDEVMVYERPGRHEGALGRLRLAGELRRRRFDGALLLQNAFDAAMIAFLGRIPERAGYPTDARRFLLTLPVPFPPGILDRHGIRKIGVAGHPEGCPDIPDHAIRAALAWKNAYAQRTGAELYLVTQFCFEAEPIIRWDQAIQAAGNRLPIHIGIPGLATIKTLLGHAKACGIGPSMRFLTRQAMNVAKLLTVSAPDRLVTALGDYQANHPGCGIVTAHIYPLGGLKKSADWSYAVADGRFRMNDGGDGFTVDA